MNWKEDDIKDSLKTLNDGGLILYPTDTIWGIGCDATNEVAVAKIFQLKKRMDNKSLIVLVGNEKDVPNYVNDPDPLIFEYLREIDKPVTVIYNGVKKLAKNLSVDGTIGIRICMDEFCRQLLEGFGKPIVSTSANISGQPSAKVFDEISPEIRNAVDYIVKYRQQDITPSNPSMVIRWVDGNPVSIRS